MVLADRIAVIDEGLIRQVGTPAEIYGRPADVFVAGFIGSPSIALLPGDLSGSEVHIAAGSLPVPSQTVRGPVTVGVRAHDWEVVPTAGLPGVVTSVGTEAADADSDGADPQRGWHVVITTFSESTCSNQPRSARAGHGDAARQGVCSAA